MLERRRTAGSGPAATVPTLFGVSLSQHCPARRLDPTWGLWASSKRTTGPETPSTPCSTQSSPNDLEAFLGAVAEAGDGAGLPQFVEREFREFLTCGVFEHGVARLQCEGCRREHLVPFSCKRRE